MPPDLSEPGTNEAPERAQGAVALAVGGERLELTRHRAAWWAAERVLLVADLHLGKGEALRAGGMPMTPAVLRGLLKDTLDRLDRAIAETGAERVVVVGDLLHAPSGIQDLLVHTVAAWREAWDGSFELVPGNHDRKVERVVDAWRMKVRQPEVRVRGLTIQHHPMQNMDRAHVCGHIHPAVVLSDGAMSTRVPAFWKRGDSLVLPAFTRFAAGKVVSPETGDALYAVGPRRVSAVRPA